MRLLFVVLVMGFVSNAFVSPVDSTDHSITTQQVHEDKTKRQLQVSKNLGILTRIKTKYWAQTGKTDEAIKKKLKLDGLTEDAMKASPRYEVYLDYLYKVQGREMDWWVFNKVNPTVVWQENKLDKLKTSAGLQNYERYARKYDRMVRKFGKPAYPPYDPASDAEWSVLLNIWATTDRGEKYVRKRLKIHKDLNPDELATHLNFGKLQEYRRYYAEYLYSVLGKFAVHPNAKNKS